MFILSPSIFLASKTALELSLAPVARQFFHESPVLAKVGPECNHGSAPCP